jgi:hypothetical protein
MEPGVKVAAPTGTPGKLPCAQSPGGATERTATPCRFLSIPAPRVQRAAVSGMMVTKKAIDESSGPWSMTLPGGEGRWSDPRGVS